MDLRQHVIAVLAEQAMLDPCDIDTSKPLADLGIDSLALVETIFALEEAFDISIPFNANDAQAMSFDLSSVEALVAAVSDLVAKKAA
jgi:acyl carrier protein